MPVDGKPKNNPEQMIAIAGAGIAGLAAALAVGRAGHSTQIFGHIPKALPGGIQLAPNGWQALERLGVHDDVVARATRLTDITVRNLDNGATITRLPLDDHYASISRAALIETLASALSTVPNIEFTNTSIRDIAQNDGGLNLVSDDGSLFHADGVIGADGLHGYARRYVLSQDLQYDGSNPVKTAMRLQLPAAMLPASFSSPSSNLWLGRGVHVVHYPIGGDVNIVVTLPSHKATTGWAERLFPSHSPLASLGKGDLIWNAQPLPSAFSSACWRRGPVVLAGDAAHIMPPHLAQGAGQSLQDAACLYHALEGRRTIIEAFSAYASERAKAVSKIATKAEISGKVMGLNGPAARLRNMVLDIGGNSLMRGWLAEVWAGDTTLDR